MIDSVRAYAPTKKGMSLLQKAFELIEVSQRQEALMQEFEALMGSTNGHVPSRRSHAVQSKKKVKRGVVKKARRTVKRNGPSLIDKILAVFDGPVPAEGGWNGRSIATAIKEKNNTPSVIATLANLVRQGKVVRVDRGVYAKAKVKAARRTKAQLVTVEP